jgi:hypothetical protein
MNTREPLRVCARWLFLMNDILCLFHLTRPGLFTLTLREAVTFLESSQQCAARADMFLSVVRPTAGN